MSSLYHALMWACSFWCHQIPERSPQLFGVQFPLCWRCSGIAAGTVALAIYIFNSKRMPGAWLSLVLAALLPLDVFTVWTGIWGGDNRIRFITGVIWGIFGIALCARAIARVMRRRRIGEGKDRQGETGKRGKGEVGTQEPEEPLVRVG
jgi:uncharacterized membrane protein